jgi:3-methyladenine DNA glycosylase/8-oxoguanine DNA glycosylase
MRKSVINLKAKPEEAKRKAFHTLSSGDMKFLIALTRSVDTLTRRIEGMEAREAARQQIVNNAVSRIPDLQSTLSPVSTHIEFDTAEEFQLHQAQTQWIEAAIKEFCYTTGVRQLWVSYTNNVEGGSPQEIISPITPS